MASTATAPRRPRLDGWRRNPRRRRALRLGAIGLIVLGVVLICCWLLLGLAGAAAQVKAAAGNARAELTAFKVSLEKGDDAGADQHLVNARAYLDQADAAGGHLQVRVAGHLPLLSRSVHDLRHLLRAGDILVDVGAQAGRIYGDFSGPNSRLYQNGQFDIPVIRNASSQIDTIDRQLDQARGELNAVRGGLFSPGATSAKAEALGELNDVQRQLHDLQPLLLALPDAVGASGPRAYVVAVLNPGEMHNGGGAPLSLTRLNFDQGKLTINGRGQTYDLTGGNPRIKWTPPPLDAWQAGTAPQRLVNGDFNPDWQLSGETISRLYETTFGVHVDGVIGIDPLAIKQLLKVTGPVNVATYGMVTADNLVELVLKDAYQDVRDFHERHELNNALMDAMIGRLTSGGGTVKKAKALGEAAAGRHVQLYFREPALEKLVTENGLGGALSPVASDYVGDFVQNTNASKVDVYTHVTTTQQVQLNADGSADVTRTIAVKNASPAYQGPGTDPGAGYLTRISKPAVSAYLPPTAEKIKVKCPDQIPPITGYGHTIMRCLLTIKPGDTGTMVVTYHVPKALAAADGGRRYAFPVDAQPLLNPATLKLEVHAPKGRVIKSADGLSVSGATASAQVTMDSSRQFSVTVGQ